ncbi:prenyltransferase [Micromonospora sp. ATCC 39149]|nr:prenyltransferase [Micromonospora sp. ATCC 39149]
MTVLVDPPTLDRPTPPSTRPATRATGSRATDRTLARDLITLIRPHQWAKNLLVVPLVLIDTPRLGLGVLGRVSWAVLLFTMVSALVYVWNDVYDRHRDRAHPTKRHRPIASGRVSVPTAYAFGGLIAAALVTAVALGPAFPWWPLAAYLTLNIAYSRGLKHVPLLDVLVVAGGFLLRVVQGYLAAGVAVSSWLLIAVFALCLLLILGKRRHEMAVGGSAPPALAGRVLGPVPGPADRALRPQSRSAASSATCRPPSPPRTRRWRWSAPPRSRSSRWPATSRWWSSTETAANPPGCCCGTGRCWSTRCSGASCSAGSCSSPNTRPCSPSSTDDLASPSTV